MMLALFMQTTQDPLKMRLQIHEHAPSFENLLAVLAVEYSTRIAGDVI